MADTRAGSTKRNLPCKSHSCFVQMVETKAELEKAKPHNTWLIVLLCDRTAVCRNTQLFANVFKIGKMITVSSHRSSSGHVINLFIKSVILTNCKWRHVFSPNWDEGENPQTNTHTHKLGVSLDSDGCENVFFLGDLRLTHKLTRRVGIIVQNQSRD